MSDFTNAVEKLDAAGKNWVTFQHRFIIAVWQKRVFDHFNGTVPKPMVSDPPTAAEVIALSAWQEKEAMAMYLLSQKLVDSTLTKYMRKDTVALMWTAIVQEFTQKSMLVRSNMHSKFMAMRY
jgi:hypothetical protein